MYRATKIVATLGPASSEPAVLERMVRAGLDVVRLNFSHGTTEDHLSRAALTATSLSIPVVNEKLALGTWQGIYLWEHRRRGSTRELLLHIY